MLLAFVIILRLRIIYDIFLNIIRDLHVHKHKKKDEVRSSEVKGPSVLA